MVCSFSIFITEAICFFLGSIAVLEQFLAKIGIAVLKSALAKVAYKALKTMFRIESHFSATHDNHVNSENSVPDLSLFGLEVASGMLSASAVDRILNSGGQNFEVEKRDGGLLIARNRLITDPISLSIPPEVLASSGPYLQDFSVAYDSRYDAQYSGTYSSYYPS